MGIVVLCLAAGAAWHLSLFGLAFVGAWRNIAMLVAAKALVAGVGAYAATRWLRLSPRALVLALCAYEVGPLLMCVWALLNFSATGTFDFNPLLWFVPAIPDVVAGCLGVWSGTKAARATASDA